jgi:predicted AAA+ superfamily ATPase
MNRTLLGQLQAWKYNPKRKPLILMGARQVGKTTLLKQWGASEYAQCVYLNFEERPGLNALFQSNLTPDKLLKAITLETNVDIQPEHTLIILDEIQECPEALNSLKYFQEQAPQYHICAAGSLLGVKLAHTKGFPVGKVNFLNLYPLSFSEFLEAIDEKKLKVYIETLETIEPLAENIHQKLLAYFKIYLFVGGMPEAVAEYVDSEDFSKVRNIQTEILKAYDFDFAKHASKEDLHKIGLTWDAIPSQLAKENKKFIYSVIRKGARAKEFESAIQWLNEAGLIHKVFNITTPKIPIDAYAVFDFFKVYLVDVGLLGAMVNLSPKTMIHGDQLFQEFQGSLIENYAAQELVRSQHKLYYWTSEGKAEVDFVIQENADLWPLEIKSGYSDKKKSLRVYANQYKPRLLIRSSPMNLKKDGDILNCPLYLLGELKRLLSLCEPITRL